MIWQGRVTSLFANILFWQKARVIVLIFQLSFKELSEVAFLVQEFVVSKLQIVCGLRFPSAYKAYLSVVSVVTQKASNGNLNEGHFEKYQIS